MPVVYTRQRSSEKESREAVGNNLDAGYYFREAVGSELDAGYYFREAVRYCKRTAREIPR
jgi:hypothetical protein